MGVSKNRAIVKGESSIYFRLAAGMIAFGSATPVSKIVTSSMPVFVGSLLRVAIGAAVLAPFAWRKWPDLSTVAGRDWILIAIISVFGMFGFSALMLYGMGMIPGVKGAVVMSTTPAITAGVSILFLGEDPNWRKIASIVCALVGILILQLDGDDGASENGTPLLGAFPVLGAVCCEVVYTLVGRKVSRDIDPVFVAFMAAVLSVPLFVPFAWLQWQNINLPDIELSAWFAIVWYGAGTLALGSWLWYSGIAQTEGSVAAGFMALMPASALILSYVLLDEPFRLLDLLGFAVVFSGVLLMSREHYLQAK